MLQGEVSTRDIVVGGLVLAALLPVLLGVGRAVGRFRNRRFAQAWRPLMGTLDGAKVVADGGGGAASSWLTGTYRGTDVFASMTPDVRHAGPLHSPGHENRFETGVRGLAGAHDWSVRWTTATLGIGTTGWHVASGDRELAARLEHAGVRALVAPLGRGEIRYGARPATLVLHQDVRPLLAPPPERFRQELDVLLRLAEVAAPLNRT